MEHDFDTEGFLRYMKRHFSAMDNHFTYDIVERLAEYAVKYRRHSRDAIPYFLSCLIPGLEFGEAAMFADDAGLTNYGLKEKQAAINRRNTCKEE